MGLSLCQCGCGQPTKPCPETDRGKGWVKGQPLRFIRGHQFRGLHWTEERKAAFSASRKGKPRSEETRKRISDALKAIGHRPPVEAVLKSAAANRAKTRDLNPHWKGGISMVNGYRCLYRPEHPRRHPNGYVYEHILVAEDKLGRHLTEREVVHHLDGHKTNNHPDNLVVVESNAEHIHLYHQPKEMMPRSS